MIALLFIILGALCIVGLINKFRAFFSGRYGTRFFQPVLNVGVQLSKASLYSDSSTVITRLAAPIYLGSVLLAAALLPLGASFPALISFDGDVIFFCMLLALSRLVLIFAAMDSGSSFQGMGAARDSLFAIIAEPAFFLLFATLSLITGCYSFSTIFASFDNLSIVLLILSIVVGYGLLKLSFVECGRVPIDDSRTHLELTMIGDVMMLDFGGIDLAYFTIAGWLKLSIFAMLLVNVLIPAVVGGWFLMCCFVVGLVLYGLIIAFVESFSARNRMNKNATYIVSILAVGLLAFIVALLFNSQFMINN